MKIWKVITNLTEEENDNIVNFFSDEDAAIIYELDEKSEVFGYDEIVDGMIHPYLLCTEEVIKVVADISKKYNLEFDYTDITDEFLMGMYEIPDSDFTDFRVENLTEDLVYRKIKELGVDSLTELDKKILELSV